MNDDKTKEVTTNTQKEMVKPKEKLKLPGWIQNCCLEYNDYITYISVIIYHMFFLHFAHGNYGYKISCSTICQELIWLFKNTLIWKKNLGTSFPHYNRS